MVGKCSGTRKTSTERNDKTTRLYSRSVRPMKPSATVFLATALICAPLFADQALFRNASIGYGGGLVLEMKAADVDHDGKQDVILFQAATPSQSACSIITMFG